MSKCRYELLTRFFQTPRNCRPKAKSSFPRAGRLRSVRKVMPFLKSQNIGERRWRRFSWQIPVRLVVHRSGRVDAIDGKGLEFNEGGMCILADVEMETGEQVTLEFTTPSTIAPVRLWASVRNRHGHYYGLEFLTENDGERLQVERYRDELRATTRIDRSARDLR